MGQSERADRLRVDGDLVHEDLSVQLSWEPILGCVGYWTRGGEIVSRLPDGTRVEWDGVLVHVEGVTKTMPRIEAS